MTPILILLGRSCSGKDSIGKLLETKGYKKLITYTTRDIRDGEVDGVSYHFISTDYFLELYLNNFFAEIRHFHTVNGVTFYGSVLNDFLTADNNTYCTLTPDGFFKLKNIFGDKIKGCFINVSEKTILERQRKRRDNPAEAEKRNITDKIDFKDIDKIVDFTVFNERDLKLSQIAENIDLLYKTYKNKLPYKI